VLIFLASAFVIVAYMHFVLGIRPGVILQPIRYLEAEIPRFNNLLVLGIVFVVGLVVFGYLERIASNEDAVKALRLQNFRSLMTAKEAVRFDERCEILRDLKLKAYKDFQEQPKDVQEHLRAVAEFISAQAKAHPYWSREEEGQALELAGQLPELDWWFARTDTQERSRYEGFIVLYNHVHKYGTQMNKRGCRKRFARRVDWSPKGRLTALNRVLNPPKGL